VLTDLLEAALQLAPTSKSEAVKRLLRFGEYEAARAGAGADAQLVALVEATLNARREAFVRENAALLEQGKELRVYDVYIDLCLEDIEKALDRSDFDAAQRSVGELEEFVRLNKRLRDPVRQTLATQLSEAGIEVTDEMTAADLEAEIQALREASCERRRHVEALVAASNEESLPASLRDAWRSVAQRIDRPSAWPQPEDSQRIATAIGSYRRLLRGRAKFVSSDRATFDVLTGAFEAWLPGQLNALESGASSSESRSAIQTMVDVAGAIEELAPDPYVLAFLGRSPVPQRPLPEGPAQLVQPSGPGFLHPEGGTPRPREEPTTEDWSQILEELLTTMAAEPPNPSASVPALRQSCLAKNWAMVRSQAAALGVAEAQKKGRAGAADSVALFALAVSRMASADDPAFRETLDRAAITLAGTRRAALEFYLSKANIRLFGPTLLLEGLTGAKLKSPDQGSVQDRVAGVLAELTEAAPDSRHEGLEWLSNLLYKASRVTSEEGTAARTIVFQVWDCLTGRKDVANPRSDLLYLLDRMNRPEELRFLARQSARPLDQLVSQCLTALDASRSNPEVRPLAQQVIAALREQSETARVNLRPWLLFFTRLEASPTESAAGPIELQVDTGLLDASKGQALLEVRAVPTGYDVPTDLLLEIQLVSGSQTAPVTRKLLEDEPLLKTRIYPIEIPLSGVSESGALNLAYRLTGKTVRNQSIDSRGHLVVDAFQPTGSPLVAYDIARAWPGASGDPVERGERGFYGREREMHAIEAAIRAPDRQRSVMVIGQRRIGKTSLLLEMIRSLPPRLGAPCGVFLDIAGHGLPAEQQSMTAALFASILDQLDKFPENAPLRDCLRGSRKVDIQRFARGLDARSSLPAALDGLVDRLNAESGGVVSRLAVFIDEFDRFVNPYLTGRGEEVGALMWQLRQIVQRSARISLVLAGSGLQRLFVKQYREALYGSIETVMLEPFTWDRDRSAIQDTFLPASVRDRLCEPDRRTEVCRHALEICGGHPWYLAILGRGAATLSKGRPFTVPLLNRAVDELTRTDTTEINKGDPVRNDPGRFYSPVFESLALLDDRSFAVAKIVLAHIAQRVTLEFPWLPLAAAQNPPDIAQDTTDRERSQALRNLEEVEAVFVDRKESRVRIRIPITAAALRHRAVSVIEEATLVLRQFRAN
jgi:hypothetical protein